MYSSFDWRMPLNSQPHFSWTQITFPWSPSKNGSGFIICNYITQNLTESDITWIIMIRIDRFWPLRISYIFEYNMQFHDFLILIIDKIHLQSLS